MVGIARRAATHRDGAVAEIVGGGVGGAVGDGASGNWRMGTSRDYRFLGGT